MTVRAATGADGPAFIRLYNQLTVVDSGWCTAGRPPWTPSSVDALEGYETLVYEDGGRIAGFMTWRRGSIDFPPEIVVCCVDAPEQADVEMGRRTVFSLAVALFEEEIAAGQTAVETTYDIIGGHHLYGILSILPQEIISAGRDVVLDRPRVIHFRFPAQSFVDAIKTWLAGG